MLLLIDVKTGKNKNKVFKIKKRKNKHFSKNMKKSKCVLVGFDSQLHIAYNYITCSLLNA